MNREFGEPSERAARPVANMAPEQMPSREDEPGPRCENCINSPEPCAECAEDFHEQRREAYFQGPPPSRYYGNDAYTAARVERHNRRY